MARAIQLSVKMAFDSDQHSIYEPNPVKEPEHSIQIMVRETGSKQLSWVAFQGPQGVAVNPCDDDRFWAFAAKHFSTEDLNDSSDIDHPSLISLGHKWPVSIDGERDCRYDYSDGTGDLKCGGYLVYTFADDPQKGEATKNCPGSPFDLHPGYWHRSCHLEY